MHNQAMIDSDGSFAGWKEARARFCKRCGSTDIKYREWESSCGGYEDYQFRCQKCGYSWWVDGADS